MDMCHISIAPQVISASTCHCQQGDAAMLKVYYCLTIWHIDNYAYFGYYMLLLRSRPKLSKNVTCV